MNLDVTPALEQIARLQERLAELDAARVVSGKDEDPAEDRLDSPALPQRPERVED